MIESLKESLSQAQKQQNETQEKLTTVEKVIKSLALICTSLSLSLSQEAKAATLIDLELADYQRSVDNLRGQISDNMAAKSELETRAARLEHQVEQLNTDLGENHRPDSTHMVIGSRPSIQLSLGAEFGS